MLGRSPIGLKDHFFHLGGNDELADQLFAEIARECGRSLPSATIGHAPTIEALAAVLDQPTLPQFSPFVQVRPGSHTPPIYIAHGLCGTVEFYKLGQHIETSHAIYGIQARGVDGAEPGYDRIEEMADYYLDALEKFQPEGVVHLVGYSFGGLVALEMAQRLRRRKREVGLLVLLDTFPHPRYLPWDYRRELFGKRVRHHLGTIRQMRVGGAASYLLFGLRRKLHQSGAITEGKPTVAATGVSFAETTPDVNQRAYRAYMRYRPEFYPGKIHFVATQIKSFFPGDPRTVWTKLAAELEVEIIPGDHLGIVGKKFEPLAAVLTRYIQDATGEQGK